MAVLAIGRVCQFRLPLCGDESFSEAEVQSLVGTFYSGRRKTTGVWLMVLFKKIIVLQKNKLNNIK